MPRAPGWPLPHLRRWREYRALTPRELAVKAGIASSTLSRLEKQHTNAGGVVLDKLCRALDLTRTQLIFEEPPTGAREHKRPAA